MERLLSITVPATQAGGLLLDYLAQRFTYLSRRGWQEEVAAGRLVRNGVPVSPQAVLVPGDLLVYRPPASALQEPLVARDYRILHEDDHLLVVDKPAPLPCHPGGRFFAHTLWALLREQHGLERPAFVNRLDRETSGIVLVAKSPEAARACQEQFLAGRVEKEYLVLVEGEAGFVEHEADGWLAPDPASLVRKKSRFVPSGGDAPVGGAVCATGLRRLAVGHGLSLLVALPRTGRCHQIRATLLGLGLPVVGDKLYGRDETLFLRFMEDRLSAADWACLRLPRQALHASRLCIVHPASGKAMEFYAPLPSALQDVLAETLGA